MEGHTAQADGVWRSSLFHGCPCTSWDLSPAQTTVNPESPESLPASAWLTWHNSGCEMGGNSSGPGRAQSSQGPVQAGGALSKCHALQPGARVSQRRPPALPPVSWGVAAEALSGSSTQGPGHALDGPDTQRSPAPGMRAPKAVKEGESRNKTVEARTKSQCVCKVPRVQCPLEQAQQSQREVLLPHLIGGEGREGPPWHGYSLADLGLSLRKHSTN